MLEVLEEAELLWEEEEEGVAPPPGPRRATNTVDVLLQQTHTH